MRGKSYTACRDSTNSARDTHRELVITNASCHAPDILLCDYQGRNPSVAFHLSVAMGFVYGHPSFSGPYF